MDFNLKSIFEKVSPILEENSQIAIGYRKGLHDI